MRFYMAKCRGCSFQRVARDKETVEEQLKGHEGQANHYVSLKGPFYESNGNGPWICSLCGFESPYVDETRDHIEKEHDTVQLVLQKGKQ